MPFHSAIFFASLLAACAYGLARGGGPERAVAAIMLAGVLATRLTLTALAMRYRSVEFPMLAIDLLVLFAFIAVALRADRRWPMVIVVLHALSVGAHVVKMIDPRLIRTVYWMMTNLWIYPQLAILAAGTWRHRHRLSQTGSDASWSRFSTPG